MDLERHLVGSVITGCIVAALCTSSVWTLQTHSYVYILAVTMFFGLLPELSKSSSPQQWFYRVIFIALVYFSYQGELKLATSLAIISIIPLLSQGYNWMHNLWSAILIPISLVLLYGIFLTQGFDTWKVLNLELIEEQIKLNLWFILAGTMGWLTNILIDKSFGSRSK
jgi:hypothetical protein